LALGRHIEGLVDAYYGPPQLAARVGAEPVRMPARLADEARALLSDLEADAPLDATGDDDRNRRAWLTAQVRGLWTTARRLAGDDIGYVDEVEQCYGVRPEAVPEDQLRQAHLRLAEALPGDGPLPERLINFREAQSVPIDLLPSAISSLAEDLRERTQKLFGLPDEEHVDFELVTGRPWSGFNTYLGGLRSRVDINTDLPVLSVSLAHLVAHEAWRRPSSWSGHRRACSPKGSPISDSRSWWGDDPKPSWPSTSTRWASATTPRSSPPWPKPEKHWPPCGATPPCGYMPRAPIPTSSWTRWRAGPCCRAHGP
jgi:hypothetical protein